MGPPAGKGVLGPCKYKKGQGAIRAFFSELDTIPIVSAARASESATLSGNSVTQPIFGASRAAGSATANAIRSALNGVSPHAGTNAVNALHGFIQSLGGPAQASAYITTALAMASDYAVYFIGMTAMIKGVNKYLGKRKQKANAPEPGGCQQSMASA